MTATGKNVTPPELKSSGTDLRNQILSLCDAAFLQILRLLQAEVVVCVGKFAHARVLRLVKQHHLQVKVVLLMHPSPINPLANKGWKEIALKALQETDILTDLTANLVQR